MQYLHKRNSIYVHVDLTLFLIFWNNKIRGLTAALYQMSMGYSSVRIKLLKNITWWALTTVIHKAVVVVLYIYARQTSGQSGQKLSVLQ